RMISAQTEKQHWMSSATRSLLTSPNPARVRFDSGGLVLTIDLQTVLLMLCNGMSNLMLSCRALAVLGGAFVALGSSAAGSQEAHYWPQFRGPNCSGVAVDAHPPVNIGPSNAVLWSTEVP